MENRNATGKGTCNKSRYMETGHTVENKDITYALNGISILFSFMDILYTA